ncbi:N-acetyltransferase GCN5 [Thalassotalea loyana]|uniref:N-acetyltransferase GCN5 n=1 Tax=Thalassotalea loyana TaxID=280483 RepID=A0ABQ6HB56_9GAMM|nr:N-acetyltransferase [Thalassotalea loyana]GLX85350.1 N-acetyltransferase GCN5 [Thalassotalea loyana]
MHAIRQATSQDIARMAEIEGLCFPPKEAASLQAFQQRFKVFPECFYVLTIGELVVGHINGCINHSPELPDELYAKPELHCPDGDFQTIFGLAVDPNYQKRGYASQLTEHFIKVSQANGRKGIILTCKDYLVPFYNSFGFVHQGASSSSHGGAKWNDMLLTF